jgi:hypothetical protein
MDELAPQSKLERARLLLEVPHVDAERAALAKNLILPVMLLP